MVCYNHANLTNYSYIYNVASVVIIGGGAAGCFCAAVLSGLRPGWQITVLEAGPRPMAKLAITGGGRCNITNSFEGVCGCSGVASSADFNRVTVRELETVYPRGAALMKRLLSRFGPSETLQWFRDRGVEFTLQSDRCVFPASQDAMQIVHTLERAMRDGGVQVHCNCKIASVNELPISADAVVVATGGGTAARLLAGTDIELVPDVPSLFTFKINDAGLRSLMGTVVDNVVLGLAGTRFRSSGTLLLTDWGVSGPATLRLSSYAARWLADNQYRGTLLVNWLGISEAEARERLAANAGSSRLVVNSHPSELTDRLWRHLVERAGIAPERRWSELGSKGLARLINVLISDTYEIAGRARFKEEFVTCGGICLSEINPSTLESRIHHSLFFAGEVLDIDALTGGFNLQAAWSTAWIIANAL